MNIPFRNFLSFLAALILMVFIYNYVTLPVVPIFSLYVCCHASIASYKNQYYNSALILFSIFSVLISLLYFGTIIYIIFIYSYYGAGNSMILLAQILNFISVIAYSVRCFKFFMKDKFLFLQNNGGV